MSEIKPFLTGFNTNNNNIYGIASCPEADIDKLNYYLSSRGAATFIEYSYDYWGRVDLAGGATHALNSAMNDLTQTQLESGRLIMSDILYYDASTQAFRYNHGNNGWAFNETVSGQPIARIDKGPAPDIRGINQCFGDGHVVWKRANQFPYLNKMNNPAGYGGGAVGSGSYGDCNYY